MQTVVGLLDNPGAVKELDCGTYVLLQPEWGNAYAQAVIRTPPRELSELGCPTLRSIVEGHCCFTTVERDGAEVFQIKNERWATYWQQQAYPVLLVIRTSDGEIRWMDVSEYLRRAQQPVKQIVFSGERFDVMSVRRWRDAALRG